VEDEANGGSLNNPPSLNPSSLNCPKEAKSLEVSEVDLQILQHQKLQLMYMLVSSTTDFSPILQLDTDSQKTTY